MFVDAFGSIETRKLWNREFIRASADTLAHDSCPDDEQGIDWSSASLAEIISTQPASMRKLAGTLNSGKLADAALMSEATAYRPVATDDWKHTEIPSTLAELARRGYRALSGDASTSGEDGEELSLLLSIQASMDLDAVPDPEVTSKTSLSEAGAKRRAANGPLWKISPDFRGRISIWNSAGRRIDSETMRRGALLWADRFPGADAVALAARRRAIKGTGAHIPHTSGPLPPAADDNTFRDGWTLAEEHEFSFKLNPCGQASCSTCGSLVRLASLGELDPGAAERAAGAALLGFDGGETVLDLDALASNIEEIVALLADGEQDDYSKLYEEAIEASLDIADATERQRHTLRVHRIGRSSFNNPLHHHRFLNSDKEIGL